jgi:hypothetical protein
MTIYLGDGGGIVFRSDGEYKKYYFRISKNGKYTLWCSTGYSSTYSTPQWSGHTSAFNQGPGQPNVIAVVAQSNSFDLYINFQHILHATDNALTQGTIGVVAESVATLTQVGYTNAKIWEL